METGFPPNRLRNLTLLESLRVPALGIHSFSLTIIKLLTSVDYSRVVVTGNELLTTEGAPFRCALGVRDSAKGVRGGRESLFAFERRCGGQRGRSENRQRPQARCRTSKNTISPNSKSGSEPRGDWLSAKSTAKPCTAQEFESSIARNPFFLVINHQVAHHRQSFSCSCHGNPTPRDEGATFRCDSSVRDRAKGVRDWRESCSRLSETAAGGVAARGAGNGREPATGQRKTLEDENRNRDQSPVEAGSPPNRPRNSTLLESLRVPALEIHPFSLSIIKLLIAADYFRVVVTGARSRAPEGATFHCASSVRERAKGVRDSAKGVRGWRESCSRLSEAATDGVATHGAGNGRGPATGHRKTP